MIGRAYKDARPDIDLGARMAVVKPVFPAYIAGLVRQGDEWSIEDLGSTNGTFVNGAKVAPHQKKRVKSGDIIRCGQIELQFHVEK